MSTRRNFHAYNRIWTVKRKTIIFFLIILGVSLTSLGVRLTAAAGISSNSVKPKPRPRAVIQTQIKTCKQLVKSFTDTLAFIPVNDYAVTIHPSEQPLQQLPEICGSAALLLSSPCRAPPPIPCYA